MLDSPPLTVDPDWSISTIPGLLDIRLFMDINAELANQDRVISEDESLWFSWFPVFSTVPLKQQVCFCEICQQDYYKMWCRHSFVPESDSVDAIILNKVSQQLLNWLLSKLENQKG